MRVKNLLIQVEYGELQLMRPKPCLLIRRPQPQPIAEKQKDIRRLSDVRPADAENRWRKWRTTQALAFEYLEDRRHAAALLFGQKRYIDVSDAGFLEREAHEFGASLNARP